MSAARILWTKQVRKKSKTYNDGFLLISTNGQATLFDEAGKELSTASGKLPYGLAADPSSAEDVACFEGYLVQGDSPCDPADIWSARGSSPHDSTLRTHTNAPNVAAAGQAPSNTSRRPALAHSCAIAQGHRESPKAPQLGSRQHRLAAAAKAKAGPCDAGPGSRPALPGASSTAAPQPQPGPRQGSMAGSSGAGLAEVPVHSIQADRNISCAATLQSDIAILQLLDSITPLGCSTWSSSCGGNSSTAPTSQQQPQQQQQVRTLPAVPQFGRGRQRQQQQQQPQLHGANLPDQQAAGVNQQQPYDQQQLYIQQQSTWQPQQTVQQYQHEQQQQQQRHVAQPRHDFHQLAHGQAQSGVHQQFACARTPAFAPQRHQLQPPQQQQAQQQNVPAQHFQQQQQARKDWGNPAQLGDFAAAAAAAPGTAAVAAAFKTARAAWSAPQPAAGTPNGFNDASSSWQAQQAAQPLQHNPEQQQQQCEARSRWHQQQPAATLSSSTDALEPAAPGVYTATQGQPVVTSAQQRGGFKVPRAAAAAQPGTHTLPHLQPPQLPLQQQQQQREGRTGAQAYCYPGPSAAGPPQRRVQIPDSFSSAQQYLRALTAALTEEVNLQLSEQARTFYALARQVQSTPAAPAATAAAAAGPRSHVQQQQQQWKGPHQQKQPQHGSKQQGGSGMASRLQAACARAGLHYHPAASLAVYHNSGSNNGRGSRAWGKGKKRGRGHSSRAAEDEDEGDEGSGAPVKAMSLYLTLPGKLDRRQFRKHDLWVLSNQPLLKASAADSSGPYDRLSQPWVVLTRSLWHGPDRDSKMEVELLPGQQQQLPAHHKWQRRQAVTALQGPDVATDVQMAEFISSSNTLGWQLMACLLHPASSGPVAAGAGADAAAATAAVKGIAPVVAAGPADAEGATEALVSDLAASRSSQGGLEDGETAALVPLDRRNPEEDGGVGSAGVGGPDVGLSHSQEHAAPAAAGADAAGGDSSSSQEMVPVRRHKCRLRPTRRDSSAGSASSEELRDAEASPGMPTAATAAGNAVSSDSDWDADFQDQTACRPGKRARRGTGAAAVLSDSPEDDSCDSDMELGRDHQQDAAAPPAAAAPADNAEQGGNAAAEAAAAAQKLLRQIVQQFRLNPAQAAVAAHVADWLPQLMQDVQERQQQGGRKGSGRIRTPALLASKTSTSAGRQGSSKQQGAGRSSSSSARPPVCLIHGPFGSGKSSLLVAIIHLLTGLSTAEVGSVAAGAGTKARSKAQPKQPLTPRILVAAHTNVAVDRVLLGLLDAGFSNMLRVGSLPRIAKRLLGVSLHSADDSRDALSQLNGMLQNAAGVEEAMIRSEIAAIQAGAERRRRKALSTAAVVGITCCSALQSTLEGQVFDVVLLDESSQMTEPTSLVPLLRAKPRFLIAAGDPCQLPPVLASPTGVTPSGQPQALAAAHLSNLNNSSQSGGAANRQPVDQRQQQQRPVVYGLLRPLFVRLTHLGHVPHLLTHQYRCHPTLSLLSNKHFYNSRLIDGVSAAQRAPLVPGLPPLVLCDCQGGSSQAAGGGSRSSINKAEAKLVAQLVTRLLRGACGSAAGPTAAAAAGASAEPGAGTDAGAGSDAAGGSVMCEGVEGSDAAPLLEAHQLGVICFFRGQAGLIKQLIAADPSCPSAADVQVATVDSFQGAEKEVVILAATTTNPHSEFCSDGARLNVALTRARRHLVVVGAAAVLSQTPSVFRELVSMTRSGQQPGAAYMPAGSLLQLIAQQQ